MSRGRGRGSAPTRSRLIALRVLERVQRAGAYADLLLDSTLGRSSLTGPDRALVTELVYGTLRWRGRIDFLLDRVLSRDLEKLEPLVATALRIGAYQLLFSDRVPANAAVDEAVRCVRAAGAERATGLVNAVLRRLATEHERIALPDLETDPEGHLVHTLSLPPWIASRWLERFGPEEAAALALACNQVPPVTVRANRRKTSADELIRDLSIDFPDAARCRWAADGVVLGRRGNAAVAKGFRDGHFTIQDEASQLVVALLDPQPGQRILDACAAPGGKATAIAERLGESGSVLALDRHSRRLELVNRSARRLGLSNVRCSARDATRPLVDLRTSENEGAGFDGVLVDAPCSGLGTLRRNPDARWRVGPGDPARLATTQFALLSNAASVVRPGGVLVYSTCTVLEEENEAVVRRFLETPIGREFSVLPVDAVPAEVRGVVDGDGFLRCWPHVHDTDGFFAARLERRP